MITVKDAFWQELQIIILSNITSFWMKTGVMLNTWLLVGCKRWLQDTQRSLCFVTRWIPVLMLFPDLIYTINCKLLPSVFKFVYFLHQLKEILYNILLYNAISYVINWGTKLWLHTRDSLRSAGECLACEAVHPSQSFLARHLQFALLNLDQPLKGRQSAILWAWYEHRPPRAYIWKSKLLGDSSIPS